VGLQRHKFRHLQEIGTSKKGQRHELIGVHGYDIKAAMHVIRLLNEAIELMRSGTITLPRSEKELLITIRTGNYGSLVYARTPEGRKVLLRARNHSLSGAFQEACRTSELLEVKSC
jgi:hypothetical protein